MKIKPLGDRVLLELDLPKSRLESGIFVPENAKETQQIGTVLAMGPEVSDVLKVGSRVLFSNYTGTEMKIEGNLTVTVREHDVLAVLED